MSIFKNKHFVVASLMAPVLGLIGYFGVNALVSEKPQVAEAGKSYQLVEKPNCRYSSGTCGLKNGEFELTLDFERLESGRLLLKLESANPLEGVLAALVEKETENKSPVEMQLVDINRLNWQLEIERPDPERHRLRLVASANQALYFGDVAMKFTLAE
jgi:hypothetical protein